MTWAKVVAALLGLIKPLISFFIYQSGKKAGRLESESERLEEEQRRILAGKEARYEAENSDTPDPYIRD